jgi:hypothetical protein
MTSSGLDQQPTGLQYSTSTNYSTTVIVVCIESFFRLPIVVTPVRSQVMWGLCQSGTGGVFSEHLIIRSQFFELLYIYLTSYHRRCVVFTKHIKNCAICFRPVCTYVELQTTKNYLFTKQS